MNKKRVALYLALCSIFCLGLYFLTDLADSAESAFFVYLFDLLGLFLPNFLFTLLFVFYVGDGKKVRGKFRYLSALLYASPAFFFLFPYLFILITYSWGDAVFGLLTALPLALIAIALLAFVLFVSAKICARILAGDERKETLTDGIRPWHLEERLPRLAVYASAFFAVCLLVREIVGIVSFLVGYFSAYSIGEVVYMALCPVVIILCVYPAVALSLLLYSLFQREKTA